MDRSPRLSEALINIDREKGGEESMFTLRFLHSGFDVPFLEAFFSLENGVKNQGRWSDLRNMA